MTIAIALFQAKVNVAAIGVCQLQKRISSGFVKSANIQVKIQFIFYSGTGLELTLPALLVQSKALNTMGSFTTPKDVQQSIDNKNLVVPGLYQ